MKVPKSTHNVFYIELVFWPKYPRFILIAWKLWMPGPWDCIFQNLLKLALKVVSKEFTMFFHRASMLTKITKIFAYSLKTLEARASGLHFPTPYWAWSLPLRWYQNVPMMFFTELVCWQKYTKYMFTASKLWIPGPQDCFFKHLLEPEGSHEGATPNSNLLGFSSCIWGCWVQISFP